VHVDVFLYVPSKLMHVAEIIDLTDFSTSECSDNRT